MRGDPRHMVRVVFHALLPSKLWEFDETSEVYIRFGCDKLGAWTFDHGPMKALKYVVKHYGYLDILLV